MKRDFLKNDVGLNDDQINQVLAQYNKDISGFNDEKSKSQEALNEANSKAQGLSDQVAGYENQLKELEKTNANNKELQDQLKTMHENFDKLKKDSDAKVAGLQKDFAIDKALAKAKVIETKAIEPYLDKDAISFDKSGNLVGLDDQIANIKKDHSFLFQQEQKPEDNQDQVHVTNGGNPPADTPKKRKDMSLSELQEQWREKHGM